MTPQCVESRKQKMQKLIAVDPGLNLGWALFYYTPRKFHPPIDHGEIVRRRTRGEDWLTAASWVLRDFDVFLRKYPNSVVVVEWPFIAPGTEAKGEDVLKIMFMVGWIAGTCNRLGMEFHHAPVRDWKGQLSKEMTHRRIRTFFDSLACHWDPPESGHTMDALGIGAWWLGANFGAGRSPTAVKNTPTRRPR